MKNLSLKKLKLSSDDYLQREQLKLILGGGYDPINGTCTVVCVNGVTIGCPPHAGNNFDNCDEGPTGPSAMCAAENSTVQSCTCS